jgi:Carboxypeptidase regulatory-like domain
MRIRIVGLGIPLLLALALPAIAQQGTAEIGGRVVDETGAALPGVAIVITNEESGVYRDIVSGADGNYFAPQLIPGRYKIAAKLASFKNFERGGLIAAVGQTLTINITMAVGTLEETVRVVAESPLVDTTSAKVGGNIGTDELSELPAMNRNYFAAVALLPGIQFAPSNQMGNDTLVASGQTTQNNNVSVDGGYDSDDALGTSAGAQVPCQSRRSRSSRSSRACMTRSMAAQAAPSSTPSPSRARTSSRACCSRKGPATN